MPEVSVHLRSEINLAIPSSVKYAYPYLSKTIFSGFMSLCTMPFECIYFQQSKIEATINLACNYVKVILVDK